MKTAYGFTRFDTADEFKNWLKNKSVTRKVSRLQVHHTGLPDYSCFYKKNGTTEDELTRQQSMKSFHVNSRGMNDIAQHFTVYPNGKIVTGRSLNSNPAGISGWNSNAICVEIYGNFDKGHDVMKEAQKQAVIMLYGELCKKFKLTPSHSTIRPHAHFTSGGTYLGDYVAGRSRKTCPGTNFMGYGCSPSGFAKFINEVKAYVNGKEAPKEETEASFKQYIAKPTVDGLAGRKGPGAEYDKVTMIDTDIAITIVGEEKAKDGGTWVKCKSGYWVNKKYMEFVRYA